MPVKSNHAIHLTRRTTARGRAAFLTLTLTFKATLIDTVNYSFPSSTIMQLGALVALIAAILISANSIDARVNNVLPTDKYY
jgi:hypothetical protein